ncbi:MAG: hypothetical protein ACKVX9_11535 [Blastocatellia bacterium]
MEYISAENRKLLEPKYRTAMVIVFGFIISVLFYLIVAKFVPPAEAVPGSEAWQRPIYAGALILALVVIFLRRFLMSSFIGRRAAAIGAPGVLRNLMMVTILISAIAEVVAILGMLFYFLTGDADYSWRLGAIGLVLLVYAFPRRGEWERWVTASADGAKKQ